MAELSANALQSVDAGRNIVFTSSFISPFERGLIIPRDDTGSVILRGIFSPYRFLSGQGCGCCGGFNNWRDFFAEFYASFSANIAIPEGGDVEAISLAIAVNGEPIPTSTMISTPAAVEEFDSVSTQIFIPIPIGCCQNVTVENTSAQTIDVQNANLTIFLPGSNYVR